MNAPVWLRRLVVVAAAAVAGWWWLIRTPDPPDFTDRGFTMVRIEFRKRWGLDHELSRETDDPAVVAGLATAIREGRRSVDCRCGALGWIEFRRPDGTAERVSFMPAHDPDGIEVQGRGHRYRVDRGTFLRAVVPLGLSAGRFIETWPPDDPAPDLSQPR